jgi:hypothetical protein
MADISDGIDPATIQNAGWGGRGQNFPGRCALSISFEKGECYIWLRAFHTVFCPLLSLYGCLVIEGDSNQFPLDLLPELLPPFFLPFELSSSSVTSTDVLKLSDDRDRAGLLLVFGLLECCDLLEFLFFFNFFFSSRTFCFSASTVSMFLSSLVRSLDDILFFGSTTLVSRSVLDRLRYRCDGSGFRSFLTSDLTISFWSAYFEGDPSGHQLSLLEDRSISMMGCSPFGITIGFFPFPKYTIIFST